LKLLIHIIFSYLSAEVQALLTLIQEVFFMMRSILFVAAFILASPAMSAAQASAISNATCIGQGPGIRLTLRLSLDERGSGTYRLFIQNSGHQPTSQVGNVSFGGADGMYRALLQFHPPNRYVVIAGELDWWVVPTIPPRISLTGLAQPIVVSCQGLPTR
jgi:hypothetical protein